MRTLTRSSLAGCCAAVVVLASPVVASAVPSFWSVTATPNSSGRSDQLRAVSCASSSFCMAAGSGYAKTGSGTVAAPLAEAWNGRTWSLTAVPKPGGDPDEFFGVSCVSSAFCVAVGWYYDATAAAYRTLAETWNGTTWSITPTPSPSVQSALEGVSCTGPASCRAVGYYDSSHSGFKTLVESWNGQAWTVTPSPSPAPDSVLAGVSCWSADGCVAAGSYQGSTGSRTVVESWNGSGWSVVQSPNPGTGSKSDWLLGVSCVAAASCQAVGAYSSNFGPARTLTESWDGSQWSVSSSPDQGSLDNLLESVSCTSASDCVAAGFNRYGSGNAQTLIESWNGSAWSVASSPSPLADSELLGVSCPGQAGCQAAGYDGNGSLVSDRTLVETGS